ncbi:hypothetical protein [Henriciella marina]|uniref:Uncharacterized protein n=1 Tax=Henriciella marina TaxID=453851 RepID=A0ABT4LSA7_9PROT|nr:hypothetical protein [Henriciella marina]MCZ4297113.1 hypothetical protein [Henriciella marina]
MKAILWTVIIIVASISIVFAIDYAGRYRSWQSLSGAKLSREISRYIDRYDVPAAHACLYAVDCSTGRARLALLGTLDDDTISEAKSRVWDRRFNPGFCDGRTTNFGLQLLGKDNAEPLADFNAHARWSFANDRFIQRWSRFQSGAFSEEPWERCTPEKALWHSGE